MNYELNNELYLPLSKRSSVPSKEYQIMQNIQNYQKLGSTNLTNV